MIIESLTLKNIRSYNDEEVTINFPIGTVLFEGDIGSGKSTILYGIEFALFGLGEMLGDYLLSEGKDEGYATLRFNVEERHYEVHRRLKRRKNSVIQEDCYISEDGRLERLSASDLKSRVIDILRFNEPPSPRAGSLIFRYAVFTPQEQMKEIVTRNVDERLQILRRIFGIEDYKIAQDNSDLVRKRLSEETRLQKQLSASLEEQESKLKEISQEITKLEEEIPRLEEEEKRASAAVNELMKKQKQLQESKARVQEIAGRIPVLKRSIQRLEQEQRQTEKRKEELKKRMESSTKRVEILKGIEQPSELSSEELENEIEKISKELQDAIVKKSLLLEQKNTTESLIQKGVCPVCGQKIEVSDFSSRVEHIQNELAKLESEVGEMQKELDSKKVILKKVRDYEQIRKEVKELEGQIAEIQAEYEELEKKAISYEQDLKEERQKLESALAESSGLEALSKSIEMIESELQQAMQMSKNASKFLKEVQTRLEERRKEAGFLQAEIEKMRKAREKAEILTHNSTWLADFFQPALQMIEKHVMAEMNARFNQHLQRFFSPLVDEAEVSVRVNEEFTPIFERQGYEQEYAALSGGERTSIALAYRLALNTIVQQEATTGAGDLLILDEPTDGFSKEQISKMRDIIKETNCKQIIIVSHERELESMAEHIFIVEKVNGTSRVRKAG